MHKVKLLDLAFDKISNRIYTLNDHWILEVNFNLTIYLIFFILINFS